jgi:hypothetical protein
MFFLFVYYFINPSLFCSLSFAWPSAINGDHQVAVRFVAAGDVYFNEAHADSPSTTISITNAQEGSASYGKLMDLSNR